ncbi:SphA family protein [Azohydromonas australica]|uniref:SphA family protein n=1 Tax=Azohydromonas australica TaxID=364039 RepID=UPI000422F042|nr:transporter [Azohydromonas australica]
MNRLCIGRAMAAMALAGTAAVPALAGEGGGGAYPNGVENFVMGALPPPGLYGIVYVNGYSADRLMDSNGNNLNVPGFKVTANIIAPRLVWLPGVKLLGGDLVTSTIIPLVDLKVSAAGRTESRSGLGDILVGSGVAWHHSQALHSIAAVDFYLPTGSFDSARLANVGRNYLAWEPVYAASYVDPNGPNADIKLGYMVNRRNKDTDYRTGQEFHFDYALGWGFGNGITAGVGGFFYRQMTDDNQGGTDLSGSKGRAFAIGPSVKYDSGKGWFIAAKWQKESAVRNRPEGSAFWLKAVFPL